MSNSRDQLNEDLLEEETEDMGLLTAVSASQQAPPTRYVLATLHLQFRFLTEGLLRQNNCHGTAILLLPLWLFFFLYLNLFPSISLSLSPDTLVCWWHCYMVKWFSEHNALMLRVNEDLRSLHRWTTSNQLLLNPHKSQWLAKTGGWVWSRFHPSSLNMWWSCF